MIDGVEGHDFGEGGNLSLIFMSIGCNNFHVGVFHDDIAFGFDFIILFLIKIE